MVGALWVHLFAFGGEDEVDAARRSQSGDVGVEGARVGPEILVGGKLPRVDEDGDGDGVVVAPRELDEREVAVVQRAHRRHEPDRRPERARLPQRAPFGDRCDHRRPPPPPSTADAASTAGAAAAADGGGGIGDAAW